jgi:phage terminase large subunit GpA-like protein
MEVQPPPAEGARFLRQLLADGLRPDPRRTVDEWSQAERIVAEGANQGRWRNERAPYLTEVMEACSLIRPTRRVTLMGSAQIGKSQVGLNVVGQILCETPAQVLVVLPSLNSLRQYNRDKLDRMIQATPALAAAVADVTERSGQGSTTAVKRGARGAQVELVTASSSRDLQSRTARVLLLEEISEYDTDVGGRGDPVDQALARTIQWRKRGEKVIDISTPGIKGSCRITKLFEAGSGGRYLVPCPHCDHRQTLRLEQLHWPEGAPDAAVYSCEECGADIEERAKTAMLAAGAWVHERPELRGRHDSYALNALYSPFTPWSEVAREAESVTLNPAKGKAFAQQWLGQAWDEAFDLPKAEILLLRRDTWQTGRIPPGVLTLMGATDVQGDRLEWAVWGFDRRFGQWLIDTGVLEGDPTRPEVWQAHDALLKRRWTDAWGKERAPDVWGIDAGYLSTHVYAYARRHAPATAPEVRALDGKAGWRLPAIGTPVTRDIDWQGQKIGSVRLWPVGTWDMKSELATALRLTEQGPGPEGWPPGALRFNEQVDRAWLDQLLAEQCAENPRTGRREWKKITSRNEAWDLAVYARALARQATERLTPEDWDRIEAERSGAPESAQPDLAALWAPDLKAEAEAAAKRKAEDVVLVAPPPPPTAPAQHWLAARRAGSGARSWLNDKR